MPDFSDWMRADLMALGALIISIAALLVSIIAARATHAQSRTAADALRRDIEATLPKVDMFQAVHVLEWPGALFIVAYVTNPSDRAIRAVSLDMVSRGWLIAHRRDGLKPKLDVNMAEVLLATAPTGTRRLALDDRIEPLGEGGIAHRARLLLRVFCLPAPGLLGRFRARRHLVLRLVFRESTATTKKRHIDVTIEHPIARAADAKAAAKSH